MDSNQHKPNLSNQAFWDVDMNTIDYEKNARYVVEKVIERGTHKDFLALLSFYGFNRVKILAKKALYLSDLSLNFCCKLFNLQASDFKCYEKKLLNKQHWNF